MKTILFALGVIVAVSCFFVFVSWRDPNSKQTREIFSILREDALGVPTDPTAIGFLNLSSRVSGKPIDFEEVEREFSLEAAIKSLHETQRTNISDSENVIEGTIRRQQYRLAQIEYKLAQLQLLGGDISSEEFERKRMAYSDATKAFQMFWDAKQSLQ